MAIDLETARRLETDAKIFHPERVPNLEGDGLSPFERGRLLLMGKDRKLRGELTGTYMGFDPETQGFVFIVPTVAEKDKNGNVMRVEPAQFSVQPESFATGMVRSLRERFPNAVTEVSENPGTSPHDPVSRVVLCNPELLSL